ncbi:MAG: AAA family ATPase [Clostridiales bacterium]|nr:AAA family ATPase [Clostridiales bacterium]
MEKIKVIAVANQDGTRFELKNKLHCNDIAFLGFTKSENALEKILSLMPNVAIVVHEGMNDSFLELAEKIFLSLPGCSVILLSETIDIDLMEKAMHAGIRKVLPFHCDTGLLTDNINLVYKLDKTRVKNFNSELISAQSKVISVFGAKGGIGKTTIAVNLAVCLAQTGKKVIIIDLDLQFGDVNLFFDLEPRDTIAELVQDKLNIDIDTIRSFIKLHSSGVSVLCAPKSPEFAEIIRGEHIEKIINTIRPYYDYIIIDTPPIFNETTIAGIENSDMVLLTISLDISTLRNAKISMDIFDSLQQKEKINILINRNAKSIISIKDAQNILDFPIKHKISNDWKTATTALNKGIPVVLDAPRSLLSYELSILGKAVANNINGK